MNIIVNICILCLMVLKIDQVAGCYGNEPTWGGGVNDGYNWQNSGGSGNGGGYGAYARSLEDPLDTDSDFNLIGAGWCRPGGCDLNDNACGVNGYYKDESNSDECRSACLQEPSCTGYAISTPLHWFPNRCFVHGNILSTETVSGWKVLQKQHFVPTKSTGASNSHCWQRRGEYDIDPATIQEVPPSEPKVQQEPHDQAPKGGNPLSNDCLRKAGVCFATCRAPPTTCEGLDSMLKEGGCASTCPPCVGETMTLIMGCSRIE